MKLVLAILLALPFSVLAQQRESDDEINARLEALSVQRNSAQDQIVVMAGRMNVMQKEIDRLKAEAAKCKDKKK